MTLAQSFVWTLYLHAVLNASTFLNFYFRIAHFLSIPSSQILPTCFIRNCTKQGNKLRHPRGMRQNTKKKRLITQHEQLYYFLKNNASIVRRGHLSNKCTTNLGVKIPTIKYYKQVQNEFRSLFVINCELI